MKAGLLLMAAALPVDTRPARRTIPAARRAGPAFCAGYDLETAPAAGPRLAGHLAHHGTRVGVRRSSEPRTGSSGVRDVQSYSARGPLGDC